MKVLFVGIGSIARRHIRNLSEICENQGIDLTIDALRRDVSVDNAPNDLKSVYTDIEQLPRGYDAIFLTNPTEYHADMLVALHDYGEHFFIEKPIATINTLDILQKIDFRKESVYYVACPLRYTNVIQYIKREINIDVVNSVRSISSSYLPDWRPGTDYRKTYSSNAKLGGGVDIDLIHEWDYLTYLFGMPSDVKSYSGRVSGLEIDSCDYAVYIAQYDNMIAELHLDYFGRKSIRAIEVFTEDETIRGDLIAETIEYMTTGEVINLSAERDICQKRELQYFLDTINSDKKSQNDIDNAIRVLKLTQGMLG